MTRVNPPYFFDEFLLPLSRKKPTEREAALGLSVKDLNWIHARYGANHAARQNTRMQTHPMLVESLVINAAGQPPIPLAGAFLMSPTPDNSKSLLYTPYGGIQVFENHKELFEAVDKELADPVQRVELMRFLSIAQRNALPVGTKMTLTTTVMQGAVSEDQLQALKTSQLANVSLMLEQLKQIPTLPDMLDTLLGIMARPYFPNLDQRDTRVNCFTPDASDGKRRRIDSLPLSDALLQFYVKHAWPKEQTREFLNPRHITSAFTAPQLEQDRRSWETLIEQTSDILSKLLGSLLQTYWNEDIGNGTSRLDLFAQVMADKFRLDVLLKRQNQIISADESQLLQVMFLDDQTARSAQAPKLSVDKVRVYAPYQHYVELASTLMIHEKAAYLYTQSRGLQVLADLDDLKDTLLSMLKAAGHEDELFNFLSLDERNIFIGLDQMNIAILPVTGGIFSTMVEDISLKQISNMNHVLELFRRSNGQVDLTALLDSALDIRTMLDDRLAALDAGGRWTVHPVTSGNGRPSTVKAERARLHLQRLETASDGLAIERKQHPNLRSMVAQVLDAQLQKERLNLQANDVYINTYATSAQEREDRPPATSLSMVEHFIERLSLESGPVPATSRTWFYTRVAPHAARQIHSLTLKSFNALIDRALTLFANHSMREIPRLFLNNTRDKHAHSMLVGLRSEAELRLLDNTMAPLTQAVLDTVLRPESLVRITRHGINGFMPDAYALTLGTGTPPRSLALANLFVLTERGGIDPQRSGQAVLWTPAYGYEVFASVQAFRAQMEQRLVHPIKRLALLENLPTSQWLPHQVYRLGPLQRIDDHLLENRVSTYSDCVMDGADRLLSLKLSARALQDRLDTLIERPAPTNLARAAAVARTMIEQQGLPVWLGMAPVTEQVRHAELLEQYHNSAPQEEDYLHGITPMREHAHARLLALLQARFPGQSLDPDNILIPLRQALDIHLYSLTDFALRHWPDLNADTIRPRSRNATPLPVALDANAVIQLVRQLDLKSTYQDLLQTHLNAQTDDARERRHLFCRQLPWQTLQYAHELKLQERLSAHALNIIQQAFDMPDAQARSALDGEPAMVRPLELIATEGASAVKVLGMYLIGLGSSTSSPLVLYAPYSEAHAFKEYVNEQALLDELERPGPLQDFALMHLEEPHQSTYRHLMQNNHHRPSDIHLARNTITGNFLHYLFNENLLSLLKMLGSQFEEGLKTLWDRVVSLFGKGIPTAVQFMAGKLAYPLVVWRSYKLFKRSAEELQLHQWKAGMRDFIKGVAQMAALRSELEGAETVPPGDTVIARADLSGQKLPTAMTLATLDVTAPPRTQLQPLEEQDIALKDVQQSIASHVYVDKTSLKNYVPLEGKVYPVKKTAQHWRLGDDEQTGPYVGRNSEGKWVLDLSLHEPKFGKVMSSMKTRKSELQSITIEARGITEIAALNSWKAQVINEALNVANFYAFNCKRNLARFALDRDADSRVGLFLGEMFGVISMTPEQVERIEKIVRGIVDELSDPSLTGRDSRRFVTGRARLSNINDCAFILTDDQEHKLYLTNTFFYPDLSEYHNRLNATFDIFAHARASTLIHELTHLKFRTEDFAYLQTMHPFADLIDTSKRDATPLKTSLEAVRETAFSTMTPARMLFRAWDDVTNKMIDYGVWTSTNALKQKVLTTTGAKTLDDARHVFMSNPDKRIDTILANADSVTALIINVGRLVDAGA